MIQIHLFICYITNINTEILNSINDPNFIN